MTLTPEQILAALKNSNDKPHNTAQVVKAALDKEKAAPKGGLNIYCNLGCNPEGVSGENASKYTPVR